MPATNSYDYIIAGAGCAGLSLAVHMAHSGLCKDRKILIVDREPKTKNDRTWCFWESEPGLFEPIVYKSWDRVWFYGDGFDRLLPLEPYRYKMIRGIDFYQHCREVLGQEPGVSFLYGNVETLHTDTHGASVVVDGTTWQADYVFNSIVFDTPVLRKKEFYLLQHFKGWTIETKDPVFNPEEATLMDFRIPQLRGTTFVYVMPFSTTNALVEYTLFSNDLLPKEEYNEGLRNYMGTYLGAPEYTITEEEYGIIPMTNHRFPAHQGNIIHIGTAGGQTKASSGYTFRFIQKHAAAIVRKLAGKEWPVVRSTDRAGRFLFYDSTLLNILHHNKLPGKQIFSDMFRKNPPDDILRFLDNETSLREEWKIISSLPTGVFLKAALQQL